ARRLTQAQLATGAGITRTTLNQLENGAVGDLGVRKILAVLDQLGLELSVQPVADPSARDYLRIAATTASVSFKDPLTEQELLRAMLTGKIPVGRRPHFRMLLEEARPQIMKGLVSQLSQWTSSARLQKNLARIATAVGYPHKK
ncbi:MAG: helix-turn-helix domain-containing protein, partial [Pyrinomonadaceae bacterium]